VKNKIIHGGIDRDGKSKDLQRPSYFPSWSLKVEFSFRTISKKMAIGHRGYVIFVNKQRKQIHTHSYTDTFPNKLASKWIIIWGSQIYGKVITL
jgi:hypothetical protein